MTTSAYKQLEALFLRLYRFDHLLSLGEWDSQVMMPPKGAQARGAALGELQTVRHCTLVSETTRQLLDQAEAEADALTEGEQGNLREMRRAYTNEAALPDSFVSKKVNATTEAQVVWAKARATNDFALFLPHLKRVIEITREEARYRSEATGKGLYEALFNQYESGMSLATVESIFDDIKSWLPQLLKQILAKRKSLDATVTEVDKDTTFAQDDQFKLGQRLMKAWEYDFDAGRVDISAHPFSVELHEDARVTVAYMPKDYTKAMYALIHETGHARYEQCRGPEALTGQPVTRARSMSVHESQSRFAETIIARSGAFASFVTPLLKEYLSATEPAFTESNVRALHQRVKPSFIRIQADEVCYPLHILLRYEMERAFVEGTLEPEDLPRVWNEKMQEYLGLSTEGRDDIGCLQDVHWAGGLIGYFPTYSLGSFFSAQLMATIKGELGEDVVDKCIRTGNLHPIFELQNEKIWSKGSLYETEDLMVKATGEPLDIRHFRAHLEKRYLQNED